MTLAKFSTCDQLQQQNAIEIQPANHRSVMHASDNKTHDILAKDLLVYENFISDIEEKSLFDEVEIYLKRMRYAYDHWDDVS